MLGETWRKKAPAFAGAFFMREKFYVTDSDMQNGYNKDNLAVKFILNAGV